MNDECPTGSPVERALSAQQRRVVRALLDDPSRPADPILREGETLDAGEHRTVCYELHHVVLPELSDAGVVEFDRGADEIRRGPRFDELRGRLERIGGEHDD